MWLGDAGFSDCNGDHPFDGSGSLQEHEWIQRGLKRVDEAKPSIVVCHSLPPMWTWSENRNYCERRSGAEHVCARAHACVCVCVCVCVLREWRGIVLTLSLPRVLPPPLKTGFSCNPCPRRGYIPALAVGRAMAETDVYEPSFVKKAQYMDEIWVPSKFSQDVLTSSGELERHVYPAQSLHLSVCGPLGLSAG